MLQAPDPGIHRDVPAAAYHRWEAVSQSFLSRVRERSPLHARTWQLDPPEQTAAQGLGDALHTAVLEPVTFDERIVEGLDLDRRSKANRAAHEAFAADHLGKIVLKKSEYEQCQAMRDAVLGHRTAEEILSSQPAFVEASLVWLDGETGVTCKARCDRICRWHDSNLVVDVKTTIDASKDAVKRAIARYLYDLQAAFYLDGALAVAQGGDRRFIFIFVEKTAPFGVQIFEPTAAMLFEGRHKYRTALRKTADCLASGKWPGYGNQITPISLPRWAEVAEAEIDAAEEGW